MSEDGGAIYTPSKFVGKDSDDDGIPDIVELYGLKPNGDWDYKIEESWDKEFNGIPYMSIQFPFILRNDFCSRERLENVNYGYVGYAIEFSEDILVIGGHLVSLFKTRWFEDEDDINNIKKGFEYYQSDIQ